LDEAHDVEETIQIIQQGIGLASGADPLLLGQPLKGRSSDLDALAAFLLQGIRAPAAPASDDSKRGRQIFVSTGCATCHGGMEWTASALPGAPGELDIDGNGMVDVALHDVGTFSPLDLRGTTGFDVPSLLGVGLTAPYLHDGSMPTLDALLRSGHPDPKNTGHSLTDEEISLLVDFLRSIGLDTPPVDSPQ
jgi:cytochrome c peroxidase